MMLHRVSLLFALVLLCFGLGLIDTPTGSSSFSFALGSRASALHRTRRHPSPAALPTPVHEENEILKSLERIRKAIDKLESELEGEDEVVGFVDSAENESEVSMSSVSEAVTDSTQIVQLTNQYRAKNGLPALQENETLNKLALEHSQNMASGKVPFGHDGFSDRVKRYGFTWRSAAENVAQNFGGADKAMDQWINSDGHRKNILNNQAQRCGAASAKNAKGQVYWTQLFG